MQTTLKSVLEHCFSPLNSKTFCLQIASFKVVPHIKLPQNQTQGQLLHVLNFPLVSTSLVIAVYVTTAIGSLKSLLSLPSPVSQNFMSSLSQSLVSSLPMVCLYNLSCCPSPLSPLRDKTSVDWYLNHFQLPHGNSTPGTSSSVTMLKQK